MANDGLHDRLEDAEGAIRQLLAAAELARRDVELYEKLGKRYEGLDRPEEAERAYTSIVYGSRCLRLISRLACSSSMN